MMTSGWEWGRGLVPGDEGAAEERLTLPEIAPWSPQDHTPSLWGEGTESTSGLDARVHRPQSLPSQITLSPW